MRFYFQYPERSGTSGDMLEAGPVSGVAAAAEQAGFEGFAFTDHPAPGARWLDHGGHQTLDPFVALGHVAAATSKLRLLTYLAVIPYRNPFLLAKMAATVDRLSAGRFILGAGTGYLKGEFAALGVPFDERNELFDEALSVLRQSWSGRPVTQDGLRFSSREVVSLPAPASADIPVWIGGNSNRAIERVASVGDGWMPMLSSEQSATTSRSAHIGSLEALSGRLRGLRELAGDRFNDLEIVLRLAVGDAADISLNTESYRDRVGSMGEIGTTCIVVVGSSATPSDTARMVDAAGAAFVGM